MFKHHAISISLAALMLSASALQADPAVPDLVMPDEAEVASTPEADQKPEDPKAYLLDVITGDLTNRYLGDVKAEGEDLARLSTLLSDDYATSYRASGNAVSFSNSAFTAPVPAVAPKSPNEASGGMAQAAEMQAPAASGIQLNGAAIRAMASMTPEQIEAIAVMMELMQDPQKQLVVPQRQLSAIPSLSDDNLASTTPDELLRSMEQAATAPHPQEPTVLDVGDGRDITYGDWEAILSGEGILLSNPMIPGSRFEVEEGVVVGRFGRVIEVSAVPGNIFVAFESGERIEGKSVALDAGVPSLTSDNTGEDPNAGEIIVSAPVPGRETPAAEAELAPAEKVAAAEVLRPRPRPEHLVSSELVVPAADQETEQAAVSAAPTPTDPVQAATTPTSKLAPAISAVPAINPRRQI